MGTPTYDALANITLNSSVSSINFSSISQGYRDLVLVASTLGTSGAYYIACNVNGVTTATYNILTMNSSVGASTTSYTSSDARFRFPSLNDYGAGSHIFINFMDYSVTNKAKLLLGRSGNPGNQVYSHVGRWSESDAITSITFTAPGGTFASGSTFSLYGIVA